MHIFVIPISACRQTGLLERNNMDTDSTNFTDLQMNTPNVILI